MKFINTTINHSHREAWEENQSETDMQAPQKSPLPSYTEAIKKSTQKRK